jgi:four helix bundle protein
MSQTHAFRNLTVWNLSMTLVERIYSSTKGFPSEERFGLTSQIRRAAVSIPSNIAEGARRKRRKVYRHHLEVALGSQAEVEVQLELAHRLRFLSLPDYTGLQRDVEEIGRMLNGLLASIRSDDDDEDSARHA